MVQNNTSVMKLDIFVVILFTCSVSRYMVITQVPILWCVSRFCPVYVMCRCIKLLLKFVLKTR